MHRSIAIVSASLALTFSLIGCTHIGTNIASDFSCRSSKSGCQPLSEVDAQAVRDLVKSEGLGPAEVRQRVSVASAKSARTGERTLKVVFPAHVDATGTLHDEAVVWTVVEAPRWAVEVRGGDISEPKGTMRALRQALKDKAHPAADAAQITDADANSQLLSPEDSAPTSANPFTPSSPLALPSPGGEASADVTVSDPVAPAAGESDMSPTPHVRAPRPLEEHRIWPSAAAIEAAKAAKGKGSSDAAATPKKEPK